MLFTNLADKVSFKEVAIIVVLSTFIFSFWIPGATQSLTVLSLLYTLVFGIASTVLGLSHSLLGNMKQ